MTNEPTSDPPKLPKRRPRNDEEFDGSDLFDGLRYLLEDPNVARFFEKLAERWSESRQATLAVQMKAATWDFAIRSILFVVVLGAIAFLTYTGKLEGQAASGLIGLLIGYVITRRDPGSGSGKRP